MFLASVAEQSGKGEKAVKEFCYLLIGHELVEEILHLSHALGPAAAEISWEEVHQHFPHKHIAIREDYGFVQVDDPPLRS